MATGVTPAMCMRLTGIGSQYIFATRDAMASYFDGARNYRLTLPADIPQSRFWSVMLYDRQTRSMLQTDQHAGSRQPVGHRRDQRRWLDRHLLRSHSTRRQRTTGSKPSPARAGGRSCASTTHSNRSSTRPGDPERSSPWPRTPSTRSMTMNTPHSQDRRPSPLGPRERESNRWQQRGPSVRAYQRRPHGRPTCISLRRRLRRDR